KNERWDILSPVATLLIDGFEEVVGLDQDVTGATRRIEQGEFFRVQAGRSDRLELRLPFRRLLGWLHVVLHLLPQGRLRVSRQPLPTERVLYEVFDNPVWREKLRGSRDILAGDHLSDHLGLLVRDVELVEPADDFDFPPIFLINLADELADQRAGVE